MVGSSEGGVARGVGEDVRGDDPSDALLQPILHGYLPDRADHEVLQSGEDFRRQGEGVPGKTVLAARGAASGAEYATQRRGEVEGTFAGNLSEIALASYTGVETGGVSGEDGELQGKGRSHGLKARLAALEGVEGVVEEVEDAAVGLVSTGEGPDGRDHATRRFEALQILADAMEGAQDLDLRYRV